MALTLNKSLDLSCKIWTLVVQQLRYRNRPNFKNPLPMHYKRKRMFAVCEPVLPPKPKICENVLEYMQKEDPIESNPYAVFLAGQMRRNFKKYPMTAIFHFNNYTGHEFLNMRIMLHDANFPMKIQEHLNVKVTQYSLTGTRWAPVLQLITSKTAFGFCSDLDVAKLLKLLKKMPQFVLIGLVYENRLLHRDDIDRVAKFSNILNLQTQLSSTLCLPSMTLSQSLMSGQIALSHSLSTLSKGLTTDGSSSSSSDSDSDSSSSDSD